MRALGIGVFCCLAACSGSLGSPQPNETEAREIAQRYVDAHLGDIARGEGVRPAGCAEITHEMLDSAYYTVTPGTAAGEPAVRTVAELGACDVDVSVVLVLDGGVWTAVSATVASHEGWTVRIGRTVDFDEADESPAATSEHHHHAR